MPKFGFSMTAVLALAAPAWAYYPPPTVADPYPAPAGYPAGGYYQPPDMLPPATGSPMAPMGMTPGPMPLGPTGVPMAPMGMGMPTGPMPPMGAPGWYGPPGAMMPPGASEADACGFAFDPCGPCEAVGRQRAARTSHEYWVRGDWLFWSLRNTPIPTLITTGDPTLANAAVPGGGNVTVLGGGSRDLGMFNGARITVGSWFDEDGELGVELSGFIFGRKSSAMFFSDTTGSPIVSAPVVGPNGAPTVYDFALPGQFTGGLGVRTATQLYSAEANVLHRWYANDCQTITVDGLIGYRHLQLQESVGLFGRTQATGGLATFNGAVLPAGVTVFTQDSFRTRSQFHGGQVGARIEARRDMFTLTAFAKVGAGANLETLNVDGSTTAVGLGVTRTSAGGIRALPGNIGRYNNTDFSMLGDAGIELGFQATKRLSFRVGYNLLYWTNVVRPGDTIDPVVNFAQVPIDPTFGQAGGPRRPVNTFRTTDLLAHGLILGMKFDY